MLLIATACSSPLAAAAAAPAPAPSTAPGRPGAPARSLLGPPVGQQSEQPHSTETAARRVLWRTSKRHCHAQGGNWMILSTSTCNQQTHTHPGDTCTRHVACMPHAATGRLPKRPAVLAWAGANGANATCGNSRRTATAGPLTSQPCQHSRLELVAQQVVDLTQDGTRTVYTLHQVTASTYAHFTLTACHKHQGQEGNTTHTGCRS